MPVRTAVVIVLALSTFGSLLSRSVLDAQTPATAVTRWIAPRTPWGDPDLQGVYANDNEYATPLERPREFDGKTLADVTADEMTRLRASALQQMVGALPGGRVRGPDEWWIQNLDLSKRSQPWLIIDPPDGHIPPLTAEAQKRPPFARGSFVGGPFNSPADFSLLDRCITRSVPGSMIPVMYSNVYDIVQAPGVVVITYEIVHEARVIPLDGRARLGPAIREYMGDARGHWEKDTLVVDARTSPRRQRIVARIPPGFASSSTSRPSHRIRSPGPRPSTIRRRGRGRGRSECRCTGSVRHRCRSSATKVITACGIFSARREPRNARRTKAQGRWPKAQGLVQE
jgi:hypothetical protein